MPGISLGSALWGESVAIWALVWVWLLGRGPLKPLAIAAIIFAGVAALAGVTGGSLNIARWLGPAIVSVTFLADFWVYLASWFIGVILGYIFYLIFIGERCRLIQARRSGKPNAGVASRAKSRDAYGRML